MADFFEWLSGGSAPAIALTVLTVALVALILLIVGAAFVQGREVSFWPPRVGEKPDRLLLEVSRDVKSLAANASPDCSHLRYLRHRGEFNKIGILNGGVAGDTVYTIFRTGTFIGTSHQRSQASRRTGTPSLS
jgi:hypothetical protein